MNYDFSRILFKDKDRNWDEIESKLRSESDIPLLKTSNKVRKKQVINVFFLIYFYT